MKIVIYTNPFDATKRRIETIDERLTFRQIFEKYTDKYDIEYALIFDTDEKVCVESIDEYPKTGEVYIRVMPSGGSNKKTGTGLKIGGGALAILGAVLIFTGVGAPLGMFLIGTGVSMMMGGAALYNVKIPEIGAAGTIPNSTQAPSIKGGKNQARYGARVPILLGKHLLVPDYCALPYSEINASNDQYLRQYFCLGYNDIVVDYDTAKIGDTAATTEYFDIDINETPSGGGDLYFYKRYNQINVGREIEYGDPIVKTTPTNTRGVEIFISFPTGLVKFKESTKTEYTVELEYRYRKNYGDGTYGSWSTPITSKITDKIATTKRVKQVLPIDNDLVSDPDYHERRQYDVQVRRLSVMTDEATIINRCAWDGMTCFTAKYGSDHLMVTDRPITPSVADKLRLVSVNIKASDNANNVISEFNVVGQLSTYTWDGMASGASHWASKTLTNNPAACMLYLLRSQNINKRPITDDQIDWLSFENWYAFCSGKGLECNAVISGDMTLEDALNGVTSAGRASWSIVDGKFHVLFDDARLTTIQYFTPRNSWGFSATKVFPKLPTALKVKFIDKSIGYVPAERIVYYDDNAPDDSIVQDVNTFGVTSAAEAYKHGKFMLAVTYLRPESFTFNADIESIVCTRGDRIALNHDVIFAGLFAGRIKSLLGTTNISGITTDERVIFEPGKSYGVTIRESDGTSTTKTIVNPATVQNIETNTITFNTPIALGIISVGNLFMFGEAGSEKEDFYIVKIDPKDDLSATITCVAYAPDIYTADTGTIPAYDPGISIPGESAGALVSGISLDPFVEATNNGRVIAETDNTNIAITSLALIDKKLNPSRGVNFDYFYVTYKDDSSVYTGNLAPLPASLGYTGGIGGNGISFNGSQYVSTLPSCILKISKGICERIGDSAYSSLTANADYIFGKSGNDVYKIDPYSGVSSKIGTLSTGSGSMSIVGDKLYYIVNGSTDSIRVFDVYTKFDTLFMTLSTSSQSYTDLRIYGDYAIMSRATVKAYLINMTNATYAEIYDYPTYPETIVAVTIDDQHVYIVTQDGVTHHLTKALISDPTNRTTIYTGLYFGMGMWTDDSDYIYTIAAGDYYLGSVNKITGEAARVIGKNNTYLDYVVTDGASYSCDNRIKANNDDVTFGEQDSIANNDLIKQRVVDGMTHVITDEGNTVPVACSSYIVTDAGLYMGFNCLPNIKKYGTDKYIICCVEDFDTMESGKLYSVPVTGACNATFDEFYHEEIPMTLEAGEFVISGEFDYIGNDEYVVIVFDETGVYALEVFDILTGDYIRTITEDASYTEDGLSSISYLHYVDNDTMLYVDINGNVITTPTLAGSVQIIYDTNVSILSASRDYIAYIDTSGDMWFKTRGRVIPMVSAKPVMKTSSASVTIAGSISSGSEIVTGMSSTDYNNIEIGDTVSGYGIPNGTVVLNKINGLVYLSNKATDSRFAAIGVDGNYMKFKISDIISDDSEYGYTKYEGVLDLNEYLEMRVPLGASLVVFRTFASDEFTDTSNYNAIYYVNNINDVTYSTALVMSAGATLTFDATDGYVRARYQALNTNINPEISILKLQKGR